MFDLKEHSHTRYNILTGDWILVSPHRTKRPWQGKVEDIPLQDRPTYDHSCYLCPGNKRADGSLNPDYKDPFVFTNDFASLLPDTPAGLVDINGLLKAKSAKGICRVISFSPEPFWEGDWKEASHHFVPIQLKKQNGLYNGWIEVSFSTVTEKLTLHKAAICTEANKRILAEK